MKLKDGAKSYLDIITVYLRSASKTIDRHNLIKLIFNSLRSIFEGFTRNNFDSEFWGYNITSIVSKPNYSYTITEQMHSSFRFFFTKFALIIVISFKSAAIYLAFVQFETVYNHDQLYIWYHSLRANFIFVNILATERVYCNLQFYYHVCYWYVENILVFFSTIEVFLQFVKQRTVLSDIIVNGIEISC